MYRLYPFRYLPDSCPRRNAGLWARNQPFTAISGLSYNHSKNTLLIVAGETGISPDTQRKNAGHRKAVL